MHIETALLNMDSLPQTQRHTHVQPHGYTNIYIECMHVACDICVCMSGNVDGALTDVSRFGGQFDNIAMTLTKRNRKRIPLS